MNIHSIVIAALAAAAGGALGAVGVVFLSWSQLSASASEVRRQADLLRAGRGSIVRLTRAVDGLLAKAGVLTAAAAKLRRVLWNR